LCQELVYGVVRWQATLDWLIARKTDGRPQKPLLQNLLRLGLYQIFWLDRIPPHAAVNETVALARSGGAAGQTGFINAVLRGYTRESSHTRGLLEDLKREQPHLGWSHPEWLVERWRKRWGDQKAAALMEWNNQPARTFARVNRLKTEAAALLERWGAEGMEFQPVSGKDWLEPNQAFELGAHTTLAGLPSFQEGLFYVQDPSTLLAVREMDPQQGETVLDYCAAPGGKLCFAAELMRNQGRLVAHDLSAGRLKLVAENCTRLGVACAEIVPAGGTSFQPEAFDRVLVDAPCSNTGVMRRRVDLRWRVRPDEVTRLVAGQHDLLDRAANLLRPGGVLVYSTCSLEPEENESLVRQFLEAKPSFTLERERTLLPFVDGVDGAYVAKMRRSRKPAEPREPQRSQLPVTSP
jgi:16S rRNA (cytosine967-C5)-methyltransferase